MEEDVETLSNVNKSETGDENSGTNVEPLQKLDESDAKDVKDTGEAVDQIVSSVNESIDGEGGKIDILDDQTTEEALGVDAVSREVIAAKSDNSHVETEANDELGRGGAIEKVEFGIETTNTETLDVKIDQAEESNPIRTAEEVTDMVDGQKFTELPVGDTDEVKVESVNEIEGVKDGKIQSVDGGTEAKDDKVEGRSLEQGVGEIPASVEEGHADILNKEDITMVEVRTEVMVAAEQIADVVGGVGRQENNSEFNAGMEIVDADACCNLEEVGEVDDVGTLASGGKLLEDKNVSADVLNGLKLENAADEHDAMRCEDAERCETGDEEGSVSTKKMGEGEKLDENILKNAKIGMPDDERDDINFEHMEMNNTKSLKTKSEMVDEKVDGENSNDPKSQEPVNEHFHSIDQHAEDKDVADIVSGISGTKMLKVENMSVEIAKDSKIEEPEDKGSPENKDVKDAECSEYAMVVDKCTSMEAPNNSRLEEPMVKDAEDKEMDDVNGLKHVIKENEHMAIETSKEPTLGETIDVSESRDAILITEEHTRGNIRTETDAREEAELTKKDITVTAESRDVTLETEEHPAGDIRMDVGAREEAESTRKDIMEGTSLENDNVVFDMGTSAVADELQEEVAGIDSDETRSDVDEPVPKMNDSSGAPQDGEDINMVAEEDTGTQDTEMETETDVADSGKTPGGKRKRENLSKSPNSKATPRATSRKMVGEDVCFICFDGGELVLCDRRGCPKAYHPSCVNRDEAFFKSKGRWNCGWHICSICEKNARYMCYTCTFSLCRSCIKDAVFFCIRETKGFCETCMKSVRLIENSEQESKDVTVDFDDKSSWDYLFKDYYIELKEKLSLSSAEISGARNPWRVGGMLSGPSKAEPFEARADANDGESGSDNSVGNLASNRPKRRKIRKKAKSTLKTNDPSNTSVVPRGKSTSSIENLDWASKELLEFVSYMKNGDTSMISQYDVQALLLEYIKRKNLRDPRRKSQIICDARLQNLFGKPRVGHFEMLKLLESHFLLRGEQNDDIQASFVDTESQIDIDDNNEPPAKGAKDKKRKTRRKGRAHQSNLEDYAAIDNHNISLIYLRRKLVEDLLDDAENFNDKVVGTFVRIRILGSNQKQDLYRLVQVVGTSKAQDPYKMGKKATDIMLDILNLNKSETISIDTLSNQEFTEEECKRLRQSIKCGVISRLTVGEILEKAMEIQAARVNDWLESETMRLSHLRDRASDLGRRKELRECVEKLQLLKTPEERQRRMDEIPQIHSDPNMDPAHESDENGSEPEDTKRDVFTQSRASSFNQRARGPMSPVTDKDSWSGSNQAPSRELSRNMSGNNNNFSISSSQISDMASENLWNPERDRQMRESIVLENVNLNIKTEPSMSRYESLSVTASSTLPSSSFSPMVKTEPPVKINESEKMWRYKDPTGKVQGPFSIVQLRKWNNTGYFPADLKIWKADDIQENSILLTDALAGKFPKELPVVINTSPSASNNLRGSQTLAGHHSSQEDRERSMLEQISGSISKLSSKKWGRTESMNLPSPTPRQQSPFTIQSPAVNNAAMVQSLPSPTPVSPNLMVTKSNLSSPIQNVVGPISPTPNSQENMLLDPLQSQATTMVSGSSNGVEQQIHQQPSTVQTLTGQNLQVDPQNWSGALQSTHPQPQVYGWGPPNIQNPGGNFSSSGQTIGVQPNYWGQAQGNQQANMQPSAATGSDASAAATPDNNSNVNWVPQMQANSNMMWGNSAQATTNANWATQMQPGNPIHGWANNASNISGNMNPGWAPWGGSMPGQGPMPSSGWVPPSGNAGTAPPLQGQPLPVGSTSQGWGGGPRPSNQDATGGGVQYSGGQGAGYSGGRLWNNRQPYGGGGGMRKRDTICPFNADGRCRKGLRCDYRHI